MKIQIKKIIKSVSIILMLFTFNLLNISQVSAQQSSNEQFQLKRNFLGNYQFYKSNQKISFKEIKSIAKGNEAAELAIKRIKQNRTMGWVNVLPAGVSLGLGVGNLITNNTDITSFVLTGAGFIGFVNLFYFDSQEEDYYRALLNALNIAQ